MMQRTFLDVATVGKPPSQASPGIKVSGGSLIFVSGAVAWDKQCNIVGKGDVKAQARQAFENLQKVLAQGGAGLRDIIKLNVYLTNVEHRLPLVEVRKEFLKGHNPPSTTVVVASLVEKELLVEIDAIALVPESTI
jgi:enamine deaminase RidA (YjgF/YER057c/UK114 family)